MNAGANLIRIVSPTIANRCIWVALAVLLVTNVPPFLCMRLNGDATYYDLQLQCLREGGVAYRDMLKPNFPGVIWIHALVRAVGGWSSVALRAFDLLVLLGIVGLLVRHHRGQAGGSPLAASCLALAVAWFYLSLSAWSHCQRDMWMLFPAIGALLLRERAVVLVKHKAKLFQLVTSAFVEGLLWASAFWMKPHVAVPALFVMMASTTISGVSRRSVVSIGGVLAGGLFAGAVGSGWLIASGAWPYFWETQLEWNPEYLASRVNWNWLDRYLGLFQSFSPWSWAHLVALPFATAIVAAQCYRGIATQKASNSAAKRIRFQGRGAATLDYRQTLLSAIYLGWFVQAIGLQHRFACCHVPGVILALAVVASIRWPTDWSLAPRDGLCGRFSMVAMHQAAAAGFLESVCDPWPDAGEPSDVPSTAGSLLDVLSGSCPLSERPRGGGAACLGV